jgi:hypothetical protein
MGGSNINYGDQIIQFKYYDPLNSDHFDQRMQNILVPGIYQGGMVSVPNTSHVVIDPLTVLISDGTQMARVQTTSTVTLPVDTGHPYITLSWNWVGITAWYMSFNAVALVDIGPNDLVVGKCIFAPGPTLTFSYAGRSVPMTMNQFLQVKELDTPAMAVFVNGGVATYGNSKIIVAPQVSPTISLTGIVAGQGRIDLIYVDPSGDILVSEGNPAPLTGVGSPPLPNTYSNKIVLAEINLVYGQTSILQNDIVDVRPYINLGASGSLNGVVVGFLVMGG